MQKVSLYKIVSFIALLLVFFAGTALADGEWTSISGTSNVFNTNLGNVGIGTSSPTSLLHLYNSTVNNRMLTIRNTNATANASVPVFLASNSGGSLTNVSIENNGAGNFAIRTGATTETGYGTLRMVVDSSGKVGIGTTSPGSMLTVNKNAVALPASVEGTSVQIGQADATANFLLLDTFGAASAIAGRRANGTNASRSPLIANQGYFHMIGYGYGTTGYSSGARTTISFFSAQDWTDTAQGTYITFRVTPNNTTTLAEAMRIENTGNVGIGTMSPQAKLAVGGAGDNNRAFSVTGSRYLARFVNSDFTVGSAGTGLVIDAGAGSGNSYTVLQSLNSGGSSAGALILNQYGNVGIGTTNPQSTLAVNGTITTKKVKVTETGWSDFVFDTGYKLPTLAAVESHIKQYKHLPGIPSAQEIQKMGLDVSNVLAKQMQKIEELTLYVIELQKQIEELKKR